MSEETEKIGQKERLSAREKALPVDLAFDSLDVTMALLEEGRSSRELIEAAMAANASVVKALTKEQEKRLMHLVKTGLDGLMGLRERIAQDETLSDYEKAQQSRELSADFQRAGVLRQQVRARAVERLMGNLLNPYLWTPNGKTAYGFDQGFETATRLDPEKGTYYKSDWDPRVHFDDYWGQFISKKDTQEIQRFIAGFFEQHAEVEKRTHATETQLGRKIDVSGYDPRAAEVILSDYGYLPEGMKLGPYTKVITDVYSVSIVLSDEEYTRLQEGLGDDEDRKKQLSSSSGVHLSRTKILNLVKKTYRSDATISHENEHTLNEYLLGMHAKSLGSTPDAMIASFEPQRVYTDEELQELFKKEVKDALVNAVAGTTFVSSFADEVLANKLGNGDRDNAEILRWLNEQSLYHYLNLSDKNVRSQKNSATESIYWALHSKTNRSGRRSVGALERMMGHSKTAVSQQAIEFLLKKEFEDFKFIANEVFTKESVLAMRQEAVASVDRLLDKQVPPAKIRALLSTNNPYYWKQIVNDFFAERGSLTNEKDGVKKVVKGKLAKHVNRASFLRIEDEDRFGAYQPIVEEQWNKLNDVKELDSALAQQGFALLKDGFLENNGEEGYRFYFRKIKGEKVYEVSVDRAIEPSGRISTSIDVNLTDANNKKTESLILRTGELLESESVLVMIGKLEKPWTAA